MQFTVILKNIHPAKQQNRKTALFPVFAENKHNFQQEMSFNQIIKV